MSGFLSQLSCAPPVMIEALLEGRPLVILAPHPDDETLGCGALLWDASQRGTSCHVICVTDGSRSHPNSVNWPAMRLAHTRQAELRGACAILAPRARVTWLGHPDCAAPDDEATARALAGMFAPDALVLASWQGDPHVDHEQVARLARRVASLRPDTALAYYPIWGRFTDRTAPTTRIVASRSAKDAKRRALACHRTQMTGLIDDDPTGFIMTEAHQHHFLTHPEIVIAA